MQLYMVKAYFGWHSLVNPKKAANLGFKAFQKVRKKDIREREKAFYEEATAFQLPYEDRTIDCFEMGDPSHEPIILVHGWESNAGCMHPIAKDLVAKNYRVLTFNLPGHAFDSYSYSNLVDASRALKTVLDWLNPSQPLSYISHSFGSAVVAFTLDHYHIPAKNLVFLTNPNKVETIFKDFKNLVGLGNRAYKKLEEITERKLGKKLIDVAIEKQLPRINYERLLLMHDEHDKVIPVESAKAIHRNIDNAQLITFEKIGHYKMLWNPEIISRATAFAQGKEVFG